MRGLLALATEAIISTDAEQRIVFFNRGAEEIFGFDAAEVIGRPLDLLLPHGAAATHRARLRAMLDGPEVSRRMGERRPVRGRRRNGEEFDALISISTAEHEGVRMATAIVRDVSELRAAEAALRTSEARHRRLVDASPVGILSTDREGCILAANPAFARMLGRESPDAVCGRMFPALLREPAEWRTLLRDLDATVPKLRELTLCDGGLGDVTALIRAVRDADASDAGGRLDLFVMDVTSLRRLEETLHRTEQLDLVGRLAGGVAHDFNNLLLVVRLSASMLHQEQGLSEQGRRDLAELEQAAVRAGELTQQLLAFGRRQLLRPQRIDVARLVQRQHDLLRRLLGEDVLFRLVLPADPLYVRADESQLERVLANLATNARDAMPAGGMVEVRLERRQPTAGERESCAALTAAPWVRLSFADSGSGMDAATLKRIFDPFYSTKELGRGTGLGLASVYGIITQSDGGITVESRPGSGSTFHVWLPEAARPETEAPVTQALDLTTDEMVAALPHPLTVLLVEDEVAVRTSVERVLAERGVSVMSAADARTATLKVAAHRGPIDAVISDIVLPGLSGQRVVDWVAQRHPGIRVLFISGYSPEAADQHGEMRPGSGFLPKPFAPEDLLRALARLLATR